jgi:hypothetical protein
MLSDKGYLQRRADSVGTGGISSDAPETIVKLEEKLLRLEVNKTAGGRQEGRPSSEDSHPQEAPARFPVENY